MPLSDGKTQNIWGRELGLSQIPHHCYSTRQTENKTTPMTEPPSRSENPDYAYVNKQRDLYCVQVTTTSINWRQLRHIHCELIWLISTEGLVTPSTATLTSLPLLRNTIWRLLELTQATPVRAWYFGFHRNA